jgi:hypothetical protein
MGGWLAEHRPYILFGGIVLAAGFILSKVFAPKATVAGTDVAQASPGTSTEYIPMSTSFITETTTATNSGNTSAPDAPITIGSTQSPSGDTSTVINNPPPPTSGNPQTGAPPPSTSSGSTYPSALAARNGIGDNAIVHYFSQYQIPGWVGMWFVAEKWRLPNSTSELEQWLNSHGLRNSSGQFTPLMSSGAVPASVDQFMKDAYGQATGGATPRHGPFGIQMPARAGSDHGRMPAVHTVAAGQSLPNVAAMYGHDWRSLYEANRHTIDSVSASHGHMAGNPFTALYPGTKLVIPPK